MKIIFSALISLCVIGPASAQTGPGPIPNPWYFGSGLSINYDNGGVVLNKATGGPLGPGTINISGGYYINGVALPGALGSQAANLFYASPSGAPGTPIFRAIANGDLPSSISVPGTFSALGVVNGSGITALFSKPLPIGNIIPNTGSFTTLAASAVTTNNLIDIEFPGLTSNVQGSGFPGMDGSVSGLVNFIILNNPALTAANQAQATLQINRSPSGTGGSNALVPNALLVNTLVPTTDSNFEWGVSSILFNKSLATTGSQNVALAGTTFKQGSSQVGASWGILGHCEDDTGVASPTAGCVGGEFDAGVNSAVNGGADPNKQRVAIHLVGTGAAGTHIGYGLAIGPQGGAIIDNAISVVDASAATNFLVTGTGSMTASGNIAATNGSLTNVDLQTVVPANGSFLGNAGASYQNCPLIGCLAGAHQFSGVYLKNTAQFDASKAEYMVTMDSNLNSGSSPQWNTSTAYVAGNEIDTTGNANNIYKETVASCTSSNTGTGPSGTGTGIVDGTCLWNYLSSNFAATKVGFFNSATTGSLSGRASWGAANDLVIGTGDTGIFKVSFEADVENLGLNTANLGTNVYDIYLSGLIGTFPITANINIFHPPNGTNYASRYGILFGGGYEDSIATISDQTTHNPISIWTNGTFSSEVWGDNSTSPAAINLEGTYSAAAIYIGSTPIALAIIGGDSICMHGETAADCFKWNATSAAIDFSAQGIEIAQSANGAVATALSSVGPTGSHTTVQEWFQIKDAAGTIRYVPGF